MSKLFLVVFLSVMLVSCSGGASSNTSRTERNENQTVSNVIDGNESVQTTDDGSSFHQVNGALIKVDTDGNPSIVEDPSGDTEITQNSDDNFTVTSGGSAVTIGK